MNMQLELLRLGHALYTVRLKLLNLPSPDGTVDELVDRLDAIEAKLAALAADAQ